MSTIAVIPSAIILIFGAVVLTYWAGYSFDLRRNRAPKFGGRRREDPQLDATQ